ncbi:aldehyde ferredoxin oxidoreductase [Thermocladium modestius]|uniref:Aldehyde ferredoxin oxidoreductase n=1 Tax=Thermocladium modestius TaxID=62609 RepID=A0A830GUH5_9CREN|nr:aldehyde ferredoxin oxidoreductase family protein [Thermocladium modestius]GGP21550.1 aldehyde ferredoxin oxidoreductase [Thermocladium modestius]
MEGNWNNIVHIDLGSGDVWSEDMEESVWRKYIGGVGLGSYLFGKYSRSADAFSPDNPVIITTGPLVGTSFPESGRHEIVSRSPQTTLLGESNSGGRFGFELKRSGIDGLVITGRAQGPVAIVIDDGSVRLIDASRLWGLTTYDAIKALSPGGYSVAAIGPAGEHGVLFAAVMNDNGRAAGRTGMGAVFGSKMLKAIAVRGRKQVPLHDRAGFLNHSSYVAKYLYEAAFSTSLREFGSSVWMDAGSALGDVPAHYFTSLAFNYDALSSIKLREMFNPVSRPCASCVIGCGREERLNGKRIDGPEYETVAVFGPLLGNSDLTSILEWNYLVNSLGLDSISTGVIISAVKYFVDNGLLGKEHEIGSVSQAIQDIAYRKGIGNELADGLERFAARHGIDKNMVATVKGLEIPAHDPRAFKLQALTYATSTRGACHLQGEMYAVDIGAAQESIGIKQGDRWNVDTDERVLSLIKAQDYRQVQNSVIICTYGYPPAEDVLKAVNLATGFQMDLEEMMRDGAAIMDLKREINERLGWTPDMDWLPALVRREIGEENPGISDEEMKSLLNRYYKLRGWQFSRA